MEINYDYGCRRYHCHYLGFSNTEEGENVKSIGYLADLLFWGATSFKYIIMHALATHLGWVELETGINSRKIKVIAKNNSRFE